jgi:hypothetical protein
MIKVCRLSMPFNTGNKTMEEVLNEALQATNLTMDDIKFKNEFHGTDVSATHFGNWVLTPVLDNEATKKLADYWNTRLDMRRGILENSDIEKLTIGQKVTVRAINCLAMSTKNLGKIYKIEKKRAESWMFNNETEIPGYDYFDITIKKKGSQTKGWRFKTGDECELINGWNVQEVR